MRSKNTLLLRVSVAILTIVDFFGHYSYQILSGLRYALKNKDTVQKAGVFVLCLEEKQAL